MRNQCCLCQAVNCIRNSIRSCFCPNRLGDRDRDDGRNRGCGCGGNRELSPINTTPRNGGCGCNRGTLDDFDRVDRRFANTVFDDCRNGRFRPRSDRRYF